MPAAAIHSSSSGHRRNGRALAGLLLAAVLAHALALAGVRYLRGEVTDYAFQSPDAAEYVALARGLARHGQYVQYDADDRPLAGPDTWRTPGYPLFLALIVRLAGDSPLALLLAQQIVAIATIPLLWLVLRRVTRPSWAFIAALAWCFDPFRLYYGLWLMSETLFTCVLLLACWVWVTMKGSGLRVQGSGFGVQDPGKVAAPASAIRNPKSTIRNSLVLGVLSGLLVLIRPIAAPLPLLAVIGVAVVARRRPPDTAAAIRNPQSTIRNPQSAIRNHILPCLACLLGIALTLGPWLARNRTLTGHVALSSQSGASLAYHKVVDVVLWSEGRPEYRFDPAATAEIRERIDLRLRHEWPEVHSPVSANQLKTLTWQNLNFGKPIGVDPFEASSMLWSIGLDMLAGRLWPMLKCFTVQGAFMLIFPLGLVLWPPASAGSAPFSMLFGSQGGLAARILPPAIGAAYALLTLWILLRLVIAVVRRRWPVGFFAFWPALLMFAFSLPSEDPRFRLPLMPLLLILAVAHGSFAFPGISRSNPPS